MCRNAGQMHPQAGFQKIGQDPCKNKNVNDECDLIATLWAVIQRLTGKSGPGKVQETAQEGYVMNVIERAYLIWEGYTALESAIQQPMAISSDAESPPR